MSNKCVMKKTAKYTSEKRPSPAFEANKCCDEYRWGNDTYLYRSVADKKGVCKWQRIKQLKTAASSWTGLGADNILSYGYPYNYDRTSIRSYGGSGNLSPKHDYGTTIDINIKPTFDLQRLDGKDYIFRDDDDINEMKKYVSSDDLYEWFTNKLDDLDYSVVDYGVRDTATGLVSASIFHLGNSYKDGIQMNFTVHSKLPLDEYEIRFVVEALTSFDDDGNHPIRFKGGKKYKSSALVSTSVHSNYKVSTWTMTDELIDGRYYKDLKTKQIGTQNNKKMPTFPVLDAKQYYQPISGKGPRIIPRDYYEEARFMYPNNKAAHNKHVGSKQTISEETIKPVKPIKPNRPSGRKPSCSKRNPSPPCKKGFEERKNKKGATCCYKSKSKPEKPNKPVRPVKPTASRKSCSKRNPSPPCKKGFEERKNKKGATCCYKSKSKPEKPNKPVRPVKPQKPTRPQKQSGDGIFMNMEDNNTSSDREAYLKWVEMVLEGDKVEDEEGATLGYVPNNRNCFKQTSKKYNSPSRKSPPFKANLCCGEIKEGNDGNRWISKMNKNGVCVWRALD